MADVRVEALVPSELGEAAALLARMHARRLEIDPELDGSLATPEGAAEALRRELARPRTTALAARKGQRIVGYLIAQEVLPRPDSLLAKFFAPRSGSVSSLGFAVSESEDLWSVGVALYRAAAQRWLERGIFEHTVRVAAADSAVLEFWADMGFGRKLACGVRDLAPVAAGFGTAEVRPALGEELEAVVRLELELARHHAGSPMFWPHLPETEEATREFLAGVFEEPRAVHLLAFVDGESVGLCTMLPGGFAPPILPLDGCAYLFIGVVEEGARGRGTGHKVVDAALAWARERGFQRCVLHYATQNFSGAPFWRSLGFRTVEYTLVRRLDERIAWAVPESSGRGRSPGP